MKHEAEFMGKMKISKEEADEIFARYTAKFLDRMGFHTWWNKEESLAMYDLKTKRQN